MEILDQIREKVSIFLRSVISDFSPRHQKAPFGGAQNDDLTSHRYARLLYKSKTGAWCKEFQV
jgi:hypothetical protein